MRTLAKDISEHKGKEVELMGWVHNRRDHGKLIFIDLRDRSGIAQLVFKPDDKKLHEDADKLRPEWVMKVVGKVGNRPKGMENPNLPSGKYEVIVERLEVLDLAETPPFPLDTNGYDVGEELRMEYRYLDLRRSRLQKNLKKRFESTDFVRRFLKEKDFVEVETPSLSKSTPEGARDYLVPSRLHPGKFYALPQSPQQYKQLLMIAGLERYFQIARAFRDEDTRGDRQPEFTQLDLEASFVTQEDILNLSEELIISLVKEVFPDKKINKTPFPRLTYKEAMDKCGSDRPDLRKDKNNPDELAFVFIYDFPMFEKKEDGTLGAVHHPFTLPTIDTSLDPSLIRHCNPEGKEVIDMLESPKDALKLKAYQYDLVLNGEEIAGGSIRIFDRLILKKVFELLGHNFDDRFGYLYKAFGFGVPPHGGIAFGFDRLMAVLLNEPNIREVIAFPKTGDGRDLMMDAPSEVSPQQLEELRLEVKKEKSEK